jgi:hypothetical protein
MLNQLNSEYTRWEPFYLDPQLIEFPSLYLRRLKLTNVILVACVFDQLNHACPAFENLQLSDSTLDFLEISSESLKTLEIMDCIVLKPILIRTHKLVSLSFNVYITETAVPKLVRNGQNV